MERSCAPSSPIKVLFPIALRLARRIPSDLDSRIINATRWPINLGIIIAGSYVAFTVPLGFSHEIQHAATKWFGIAGLAVAVLAMVLAATQALDWYLSGLNNRERQVIDPRLIPLLRRIGTVVLYGLGGLLILDLLSINISPLIAGLGLGGLAVALAIQPTLSNLFAGTYVMTEGGWCLQGTIYNWRGVSPGTWWTWDGGAPASALGPTTWW